MSQSEQEWIKSSRSLASNACVELAPDGPLIAVRHSRDPGVQIRYTHAEVEAFFAGVKAGEFDHLLAE